MSLGSKQQIDESLINTKASASYASADKFQDHILEQYKIYLESTDHISNRRQAANSFFVSINTALIALLSYVNTIENNSSFYWLISLAGIVIAYMWYRLIRSYRDLNTAKFKVIHQIETKLPLSPYVAEWEAVGKGRDSKLYLPFTRIEVGIPWVFFALHIVTFIWLFPWCAVIKWWSC